MADAGPCGARASHEVDVDALWRDLKARTAVRGRGGGGGAAAARAAAEEQAPCSPPLPPPTTKPPSPSPSPIISTITATTLNELLERMARAPTSRERTAALDVLSAALGEQGWLSWSGGARPLDDGCGGSGPRLASSSSSSSRKAVEVGKALVRRAVEDSSEAVRERAADLLAEMMATTRRRTTAPSGQAAAEDTDASSSSSSSPPSSPPPTPDRTATTTAAPSSCPVLRIPPLTDTQARDLLPYLLPALADRLLAERPRFGALEPRQVAAAAAASAANATTAPAHEPSEEVRLALLRAFTAAVRRWGSSSSSSSPPTAHLARHAASALAVVRRVASTKPRHNNDTGPASHLAACELTQVLEQSLNHALQPLAMPLARCLVPLTTSSRRAAVRAAAVRALAPLAHRGAHEAALLLVGHRDPHLVPIKELAPKVTGKNDDDDEDSEEDDEDDPTLTTTNFCGRLAADPSPAVRLAFVEALLRDWLTRLPGRRDHESRLVPFVLGAMVPYFPGEVEVAFDGGNSSSSDSGASAAVASAAALLLEDLGAQHERDLAHDGLFDDDDEEDEDDQQPCSTSRVAYAGSTTTTTLVVLPGPFCRRPSRGARLLARAVLGGMVGAACAELGDSWQLSVRWRAAALMAVTLVVVEDGADRHLPTLVPALCKGVRGGGNGNNTTDAESASAARWSRRCCEVLGVFCDGEVLWSLLQPLCCCSERQQAAAAVRVLAAAVRGARAAAASSKRPLLAVRVIEVIDALKDARDVGLSAAVRELERAARE